MPLLPLAPAWWRPLAPGLLCAAILASPARAQPAADAAAWPLLGRMGLVQVVLVPLDAQDDRAAYEAQIRRLCEPDRTCFVNFHTNASGVPLAWPLPDAVAAEPTARYRHSMKNGVELFQWACRIRPGAKDCF